MLYWLILNFQTILDFPHNLKYTRTNETILTFTLNVEIANPEETGIPRSDATELGVRSHSTLFGTYSAFLDIPTDSEMDLSIF